MSEELYANSLEAIDLSLEPNKELKQEHSNANEFSNSDPFDFEPFDMQFSGDDILDAIENALQKDPEEPEDIEEESDNFEDEDIFMNDIKLGINENDTKASIRSQLIDTHDINANKKATEEER